MLHQVKEFWQLFAPIVQLLLKIKMSLPL